MKKKLYYAGMLLLGMLVTTGCSNEESLEQASSNGQVYQAVIEKALGTRTSVSDEYQVLWSAEDAFTVFEDGEKAATLTLIEGDGTTSGKFQSDVNKTLADGAVALFPESASLGYTFKESYDSRETDAPMLGSYTNSKFSFQLLTAMVRVVVADVPAGDVTLTLSSDNLILTGDATINANNELEVPASGKKEVTVTLKGSEGGTLTFDVPVPVQNYTSGLSILVKSGQTEVFNKGTNAFEAVAGTLYLFGAKYVTAEDAATSLQVAINASTEGEVIVLTGEEHEIVVPSLSVREGKTASLDLNGKTLKLGEATAPTSRAADCSGAGLVNKGTLTIKNGSIEYDYPGTADDYETAKTAANGATYLRIAAIVNEGVLNLNGTDVTSDVAAIKTIGTWTNNATLQEQGEPTIKTTITGGKITSANAFHIDGKHIYAVSNIDNALLTINGGAEIKGDGGVYVACSTVDIDDVTITSDCATTNCIYIEWAGIVTTTASTEMNATSGTNVVAFDDYNAVCGAMTYNGNSLSLGKINIPEGVVVTLKNPTLTNEIVNKGTLNINGGSVNYDYPGTAEDYDAAKKEAGGATYLRIAAIINEGVLNLNGTDVTSDVAAIKTIGTWKKDATLQDQGDPTIKTTITGGKITSNGAFHINGKHLYAVSNIDNALLTINGGAEIEGDGGVYVACSLANIDNATLTSTCTTTNCIYIEWAGIVRTSNTTMSATSGTNVVKAAEDASYGGITYEEAQ